MKKPQIHPTFRQAYVLWSFSSQLWSGAQYGEDEIKVSYDVAREKWDACTEMDQCVKRDLSDEDLASIRSEVELMP